MTVHVQQVAAPDDHKAFFDLPYMAYRDDPLWRAPLRFDLKARLNPHKNPSLHTMKIAFFIAKHGGQITGRIAAFVNQQHLDRHQTKTGHFGFLDTLNPDESDIMQALLSKAEEWLRAEGMERIAGPFNFSVNDECGLLIDGFDTPPVVMMPHGRSDYPPSLEMNGYKKAMDMVALRHRMGETFTLPPFVARLKQRFEADAALSVRRMDPSRFGQEVALIMDIFNDAWSDNWGFIPFTSAEIEHMADSMKPLLHPDGLWIASIDGEPASFTLVIPNINEATQGLDGRLFPLGWAQLLYKLKIAGLRTARVPLAGTHRKFHKSRRGMTATVAAWAACLEAQHARGVREIEFSWVLETNKDLLGLAEIYDCDRYKTYRIYEKGL